MKRTYVKMILRSVRGSLTRFLSILGIVFIGTGFLAGLLATTPDMELTVDNYYRDCNTMDVDIKGSLGITDDDIAELNLLESVATAEPARVTDLILTGADEETYVARLYGMELDRHGEGLTNDFELVSGRMPEASNECLLASPNGYIAGHDVGEVYTISPENKDYDKFSDTYAIDEFTVVGIVNSPLYMSIETEQSNVGTGSVNIILYASPEVYSLDVYTDAFVTLSGAEDYNTFSDEYEALSDSRVEMLENFGLIRSEIRYDEVTTDAQQEIDDARAELDDAEADAKVQLDDARAKLDDAEIQLSDAETKVNDAKDELKKAKREVNSAQKELDDAIALQYKRLGYSEDSIAASNVYVSAIEKARLEGQAKIDDAKKTITDAEKKLSDAEDEIEENRVKLADAEKDYADAKSDTDTQIADAEAKLDDAQQELDDLDMAEWYVSDRSDMMSYSSYRSNVEKVAAIARVFPIFLFFVAALVALTTMTRMVEEERGQIGTLKALGYSNGAIMGYYVGYCLLASIIGSALGMIVGFRTLPLIISNAYSMMYVVPKTVTVFRWNYAVIIAAIAILCTTAATVITCRSSLSERAAQLMLPRAPKPGKRIFLERIPFIWNKLKFSEKVTARNMFRYKSRMFMTVFGIAGCTALLLTGFGLRDSISDIVDKQFGELYIYDLSVYIKDDATYADIAAMTATLDSDGAVDSHAVFYYEKGYVETASGREQVNIYVPENTDELKEQILLRDRKSGADIPFDEDSVILTEKLAETLSLKVGDSFTLENSDGMTARYTLTAITENYVTSYAFMSKASYLDGFDALSANRLMFAGLNDESEETQNRLSNQLLAGDGVNTVYFNRTAQDSFSNAIKKIDYIVMVLIVSAGALAMIVVYNLTNINISERKKELATIKVLGFYEGEVARYIYRETAWLTVIGVVVGLGFGILLHSFVVRTAEVDAVMFGREIAPMSFLFAAAATLAFTALVDLIMLPKLRSIDMVESMKAND